MINTGWATGFPPKARGNDRQQGFKKHSLRRVRGSMTENEIAQIIVDVAYKIHVQYEPGLLESAYQALMVYELRKRGLKVEDEKPVLLVHDGIEMGVGYRADLIVEDKVIVELKSVEEVPKVHKKQLKTYLKLADLRLGLLINFGAMLIKDGISRVANGMPE
ncbi:MAG TPA: GxxExxY protein [Anaerolineae bacterium]|nr:GxxExxY protein [Anaerolineae bacterium]